jgi:hypothetical protein
LVSRPFWWPITIRAAIDAGQAAHDRLVVGEGAVTGQLLELIEHDAEVVGGVRARRVAGQLQHLPRGQVAEDLRGAHAQLVLQRVHFRLDIDRRPGTGVAQLLDLGFQVGDGLLEVEVVRIHRKPSCKEGGILAECVQTTRTPSSGRRR